MITVSAAAFDGYKLLIILILLPGVQSL